jgi:hypothetical protein
MKENNLILEIARMREMMGVKPLNSKVLKNINEEINFNSGRLLLESGGGKDEPIKAILKSMGFADEIATSASKKVADEWDAGARQFADALEKEGLDDIGKIQQRIAQTSDIAAATPAQIEDALALYFKNNPEVAKDLIKKLPDVVNEINKKINTSAIDSFIPTNLKADLDFLMNSNFNDFTDDMLDDYDRVITDLTSITSIGSLYGTNPDVTKYLDGLQTHANTIRASKKPNLFKSDIPADTPVILKDTAPGKTKAELDAEKAAADAEEAAKQDQAARDSQAETAAKELEGLKNKSLDNAIDSLMTKDEWGQAWNKWNNLIYKLFGGKFGKIASYLSKARTKLGSLTLSDLQNFKNTQEYKNLVADLETKAKSKGTFSKRVDKLKVIITKIDELITSIPILGKLYSLAKAGIIIVGIIFGIAILMSLRDDIEFIDYVFTKIQYAAWDMVPDGISDFDKTMPECLSQINGYWDLTEDQKLQLPSIGLSCDNVDSTKYDTYVSSIKYVEASKAMDAAGKTVEKPAGFEITIGGKKITKTKDGSTNTGGTNTGGTNTGGTNTGGTNTGGTNTGGTNTGGTYTNTQADFIKWVNEKHPGKYGKEYEWTGKAGYYYPNAGNTGNAMTFSPSGWQ